MMRVHPAAALFPMMSDSELTELAKDIKQHGLQQPIVYCADGLKIGEGAFGPDGAFDVQKAGTLVDGRNRLRACEMAGAPPEFVELAEVWSADPYSYVVSVNIHRRHLEPGQRAMIAAKLATLPRGANQHTAQAAPSQQKAAEMLNVSVDSVQRARKVLENGVPELVQAVEQGHVNVKAAAVVAGLPKEEQQQVVAAGPKEITKRAKALREDRQVEKAPGPIPVTSEMADAIEATGGIHITADNGADLTGLNGLTFEEWAKLRPAIVDLLDSAEQTSTVNVHRSNGKTGKAWRAVREMLRRLPVIVPSSGKAAE